MPILPYKKAAPLLGLSQHELRTGIISGKYPACRHGGDRGRIIVDTELVEQRIRALMLENVKGVTAAEPARIRQVQQR